MKSAPFAYEAPETLEEAVRLLGEHGDDAKILAGGQSLVPLMNMRLVKPAVIVDINRIGSLQMIRVDEDGALTIGAGARQVAVERNRDVAAGWPMLVDAIRQIGHTAIRNRGTFGGSVALADPAAEYPARLVASWPSSRRPEPSCCCSSRRCRTSPSRWTRRR